MKLNKLVASTIFASIAVFGVVFSLHDGTENSTSGIRITEKPQISHVTTLILPTATSSLTSKFYSKDERVWYAVNANCISLYLKDKGIQLRFPDAYSTLDADSTSGTVRTIIYKFTDGSGYQQFDITKETLVPKKLDSLKKWDGYYQLYVKE